MKPCDLLAVLQSGDSRLPVWDITIHCQLSHVVLGRLPPRNHNMA